MCYIEFTAIAIYMEPIPVCVKINFQRVFFRELQGYIDFQFDIWNWTKTSKFAYIFLFTIDSMNNLQFKLILMLICKQTSPN